jgi:FAD/FMN-containing dehydrogenase
MLQETTLAGSAAPAVRPDQAGNPIPDAATVAAFAATLRGQLIRPEDAGYDEARHVWNGSIDRRPGLIVRCAGTADVIASVSFARTHGLLVAVRGGGHSFAGHSVCDGGMVIDLSCMKSVRIDPAARIARAEPGVLWSDLDHEAQAFGLATTGGVVSHTGIAGLTLGGGQGWLMSKHGLTVDNLLSVDIVTADGRLLTANTRENEDLFWGVRGGGGNFGIVTSFEYRLHPVGPIILAGMLLYPLDQAREVLTFYRDYSLNTPDEMICGAGLLTSPDGIPMVTLIPAWFGDHAEGERYLKPMRELGRPAADLVGPVPYVAHQKFLDAAVPHGIPRYLKMGYVPEMPAEFIDFVVQHYSRAPSPLSFILFNTMKGVLTRVSPDATAFPHRYPQWYYDVTAQWIDPADTAKNLEWVQACWRDTARFTRGTWVSWLDTDDRSDRVKVAYGQNHDRLAALKRKYDPDNLFRLNANVLPAASAS